MQHHLITNLEYAQFGVGEPSALIRLHVNAVLLTRGPCPRRGPGFERCQIRLFGHSELMPVGDIEVATIDHEISAVQPPAGLPPGHTPVNYTITVGDVVGELTVTIPAHGPPSAPVIDSFADGTPISEVWSILALRVAESWTAPHIPVDGFSPIEHVRAALRHRVRGARR